MGSAPQGSVLGLILFLSCSSLAPAPPRWQLKPRAAPSPLPSTRWDGEENCGARGDVSTVQLWLTPADTPQLQKEQCGSRTPPGLLAESRDSSELPLPSQDGALGGVG